MIKFSVYNWRYTWFWVVASLGILAFAAFPLFLAREKPDISQVISWAVAGKVIIIDPGHGGIDPGAVGPGGSLEKDVVLAVAKKLARIIHQGGAEVVMTRDGDYDLADAGKTLRVRKREDLERRVALAGEEGAEVYISIQANSFGTIWTGAQTFYHSGKIESERLAKDIQAEIRRTLRNTNRKAKALDVFVLRSLEIPTAMVEVGFLSNPEEERLLNDPTYQERMAWAIYYGIVRYLGGSIDGGENHGAGAPG